jgi:hypothetical protein
LDLTEKQTGHQETAEYKEEVDAEVANVAEDRRRGEMVSHDE